MPRILTNHRSSNRELIEQRRVAVSRLCLQRHGISLRELARVLASMEEQALQQGREPPGIGLDPKTQKPWSAATIHSDIKQNEKRWKEATAQAVSALKARQYAELQERKREAWRVKDEAWRLREKDAELFVRIHEAFAKELDRCHEREAKLMGLDAPQKIAPTEPDGITPYQPQYRWLDDLPADDLRVLVSILQRSMRTAGNGADKTHGEEPA